MPTVTDWIIAIAGSVTAIAGVSISLIAIWKFVWNPLKEIREDIVEIKTNIGELKGSARAYESVIRANEERYDG